MLLSPFLREPKQADKVLMWRGRWSPENWEQDFDNVMFIISVGNPSNRKLRLESGTRTRHGSTRTDWECLRWWFRCVASGSNNQLKEPRVQAMNSFSQLKHKTRAGNTHGRFAVMWAHIKRALPLSLPHHITTNLDIKIPSNQYDDLGTGLSKKGH